MVDIRSSFDTSILIKFYTATVWCLDTIISIPFDPFDIFML